MAQYESDPVDDLMSSAGTAGDVRHGLLRVVGRWWWIPVVMTVIGVGASVAILLQLPVLYEGEAYVQIKEAVPGLTRDDIAAVEATNLETECGVMTSSTVLERALDVAGVADLRTFRDPGAPDNGAAPMQMSRRAMVRYLKDHVHAGVVRGRSIVRLVCESPHATDAAHLANVIMQAYQQHRSVRAEDSAAEFARILEQEQTRLRDALRTLQQEIAEFKKRNPAYSFGPDGGRDLTETKAMLSASLTHARITEVEAEEVFKDALRTAYGPGVDMGPWLKGRWLQRVPVPPATTTDPAEGGEAAAPEAPASLFPRTSYPERIRTLAVARRAQGVMIAIGEGDERVGVMLESARMEHAALAKLVPATHEGLKALAQKVAELEARWAGRDERYAQAYLALVGEQYRSAVRRANKLKEMLAAVQKAVAAYNQQAAEYVHLEERRQEIVNDLDVLRTRIKNVNVQGRVGALNIEVLETAVPAEKPSKPNWPRALVLGAAAGLMLGIGLAVLRDWLDHRIRSAEEITAVLGVPVLGAVPDMGGEKEELSYRAQHVLKSPGSGVAEAVRLIRTSMFFSSDSAGGGARTILVTSPNRGDGKSTVLANVGIATAQAGRRTLIVDTDFRRPCQHRIFELDDSTGLASMLAGEGEIDDAIQSTTVEGLDVLPCGLIPSNPSEMLNSETFRNIVADLSSRYDCVLFDSPPTGPVTDALILGALCDCALLVVRAEETTRRSAEHARESLLSVGAKLMGAVINAVPRRKGGIYSFGGYGGYSSYGVLPETAEDDL